MKGSGYTPIFIIAARPSCIIIMGDAWFLRLTQESQYSQCLCFAAIKTNQLWQLYVVELFWEKGTDMMWPALSASLPVVLVFPVLPYCWCCSISSIITTLAFYCLIKAWYPSAAIYSITYSHECSNRLITLIRPSKACITFQAITCSLSSNWELMLGHQT